MANAFGRQMYQRLAAVVLLVVLAANVVCGLEPVTIHTFGQSNSDGANAVAHDDAGNYYVAGYFMGTVDFNPGPGVESRTSDPLGSNSNGFVAKYTNDGQLVWVSACTGFSSTVGTLCIDSSGNLYLSGSYAQTVDFDPGPGNFSLTDSGAGSRFIWKLDSNGALVWAKGIQGQLNINGISVDSSGNTYTCGGFNGAVDFDPDAGSVTRTSVSADGFALKLDANGSFAWVQTLTGNNGETLSFVNVEGAIVYLAGGFSSTTIDFDPGVGTFNLNNPNPGYVQSFVWKLDTSGNFIDAFAIASGNASVYGMALDANNNIFLAGVYDGTVDFDLGSGTSALTGTQNTDAFILKMTNSGSFGWVEGVHTAGDAISIANATCDSIGNVYITGAVRGDVTLTSDGRLLFNNELSSLRSFCIKLDGTGQIRLAAEFAGGLNAYGITIQSDSSILMAGQFYGTVDFDPRATTADRTSIGASDVFVVRLRQTGSVDLNGGATGLGFSTSFNQHGAVSIADSAQTTVKHEANLSTLESASVVITNPINGANEILSADAGITGIAVGFDGASNTLTLMGISSLANYQQVLRTVTYNNTAAIGLINFTTRVVNFTVNDGVSDSEAAVAQITMIPNEAPSIPTIQGVFTPFPIAATPNQVISFSANGSDPENDPLTFTWNFGDNSPVSNEQNPTHAYAEVGKYLAVVTVTDPVGAINTGTRGVVVNISKPPVVRLQTSDVVGFATLPFTFDASTSTDPENAIAFYDWDFGDGTPHGTGQVISKVYENPGTYTVTLTIMDSAGVSSSTTRIIEVLAASEAGLFNGFINYKVSWNRSVENKDSLSFIASVNVGEDIVGDGTTVAMEIVGQRFTGTLDRKLRDSTNVKEKWQVKANIRNQPSGTVTLKLTIKKANLGASFNLAGATVGGDPHDIVSQDIPVRLEIGTRSFELQVPSDFKFSGNGTRAKGDGASE